MKFRSLFAILLCGFAGVACMPATSAGTHDMGAMPGTGPGMETDTMPTGHAGHGEAPANDPPIHHPAMGHSADSTDTMPHEMWMHPLGAGWNLAAMAQAYPIVTASMPFDDDNLLSETDPYLTQPAIMADVIGPGSKVVFRTTLNFEGITIEDGEATFGGWGEGFIDRRHPHTLLHEAMLSLNFWELGGGMASLSAGKGFAPYGTDDPMSRPGLKYPTNHHLSQILERWVVSGAYLNRGWGLEAGVFGGSEPEGPYDLSNIESFGDSWSVRLSRRFGAPGQPTAAPWELSASFARVQESHGPEVATTKLINLAVRHEQDYDFGNLYGLAEASRSDPEDGDGYFSILGETRLERGSHQPYIRLEYATRPEYDRLGVAGTDDFFRYDHDSHAHGATRWLISTVGYGYELTGFPVSARPFVEAQHFRVSEERGGIDPQQLYGSDSFWGLSAGFRVFIGGDPMRMGNYGIFDAMVMK
ncbi:MAG TPA: hypothetical protein VFI91_06085 [Longimicrobiaceae bacterium]|nr:hypothetical protein [Longimicrobiaceae bacterium]